MVNFGAHSDCLKFEMARSDWSCAYCRLRRHRIIPYYRSMVKFGAFDWSRAVSPPGGATGVIVSMDLIGLEPSRDL